MIAPQDDCARCCDIFGRDAVLLHRRIDAVLWVRPIIERQGLAVLLQPADVSHPDRAGGWTLFVDGVPQSADNLVPQPGASC